MKPYFFRLSCILAVCLLFSCSERRPIGRNADARYIEDSSEKGLVNLGKINSQDFTRAANKLLQDLCIYVQFQKIMNYILVAKKSIVDMEMTKIP